MRKLSWTVGAYTAGLIVGLILVFGANSATATPPAAVPVEGNGGHIVKRPKFLKPNGRAGWRKIMAGARVFLSERTGLVPIHERYVYRSSPMVRTNYSALALYWNDGRTGRILVSPHIRNGLERAYVLQRWHKRTKRQPPAHWLPEGEAINAALHEHLHAVNDCASESLVEAVAHDLAPAFSYWLFGRPMEGGERSYPTNGVRVESAKRAGVVNADHQAARIERRRMIAGATCN